MQDILISARATTYVVTCARVPRHDELPWGSEECDAFVAILAQEVLTDALAENISFGLVRLRTDWIEIMGTRSEHVHDLVDSASVAVGRQERIGDGNPMTAWDDDLADMAAMIDYVRVGGQGATNNKLVIVLGRDGEAAAFADQLEKACHANVM